MNRKAINFDLSVERLKYYYNGDYHHAYRDIKSFMSSNGFVHRQGSGYISATSMSRYEITNIVSKMSIDLPWLRYCVETFDVTSIAKQFSLLDVIKETDDLQDILTGNNEDLLESEEEEEME